MVRRVPWRLQLLRRLQRAFWMPQPACLRSWAGKGLSVRFRLPAGPCPQRGQQLMIALRYLRSRPHGCCRVRWRGGCVPRYCAGGYCPAGWHRRPRRKHPECWGQAAPTRLQPSCRWCQPCWQLRRLQSWQQLQSQHQRQYRMAARVPPCHRRHPPGLRVSMPAQASDVPASRRQEHPPWRDGRLHVHAAGLRAAGYCEG